MRNDWSLIFGRAAFCLRRRVLQPAGTLPWSLILLTFLTLGVLWGVWRRDLSPSDTASYFRTATEWARHGLSTRDANFAFSPLYCAFLGACQRAFSDAGVVLAFHRIVIVLAAGIAILLSFRRILPRYWAWLGAAWWVAEPVNWHGLHEVHLFGLALVMIGCAFAGSTRSFWGRGFALAVLGLAAALVRNEFFLTVGLFALACGVAMWRHEPRANLWKNLAALALPGVAALAFALWLFSASWGQLRWQTVAQAFHDRTSRNIAQVYAFSYQQHHSDWQGDPWHDGRDLLHRDFGSRDITFGQALRANPRAFLAHVAFNFSLAPAGLQYGLFSGYGGRTPPDFNMVRARQIRNPAVLSIVALLICVGGAVLLVRWWRRHHRFFLKDSPAVWTWTYLLCCAPPCLVAIATQRPRPAYIFPLTLLVLVFIVFAARLLTGAAVRRLRAPLFTTTFLPALGGAVLLIVLPGSNWPARSVQEKLTDYRRLKPFDRHLAEAGRVVCATTPIPTDLAEYLSYYGGAQRYGIFPWTKLEASLQKGGAFAETLDAAGVTDLYVKDEVLTRPDFQQWRQAAPAAGWQALAISHAAPHSWELWSRPIPAKASSARK